MPPTQLDHPSPKRKRDQPTPMPLLNTALALRPASTPRPCLDAAPSSGADSPGNAVADRLGSMDIAAASTSTLPMPPPPPADHVAHKKLKLDAARADSATRLGTLPTVGSKLPKTGGTAGTVAVSPRPDALREIPETPQASQPRMLPDIASFAQPAVFVSSSEHVSTQPRLAPDQVSRSDVRSLQLASPNKPPSPSSSALTWQVSEITGHLADPSTDPDDDGTGLNGIGFKPTPAIAYARSQKRRQQLSDWKAREAREARARRSERRRRGVGGKASRESTIEREVPVPEVDFSQRTVKFAV